MSIGQARATLADLAGYPGKAELVDGRIVELMATGRLPNRVAFRIARSLDDHALAIGQGEVYTDNMGFSVAPLSTGRESFSPDASYYAGKFPLDPMGFIQGPPTLGVEVRSDSDYGPAAEAELAAKRDEYFEAGTDVVWDVDPQSEIIRVFQRNHPNHPRTFRTGETVDAEPAVPGWRVAVDWVFGHAP